MKTFFANFILQLKNQPKVNHSESTSKQKEILYLEYIFLVEEAYNLSQSDQAQSDFISFQATKVLEQLNQLEFAREEQFA